MRAHGLEGAEVLEGNREPVEIAPVAAGEDLAKQRVGAQQRQVVLLDLRELGRDARVEIGVGGQGGVQWYLAKTEEKLIEPQGLQFVEGIEVVDAVAGRVPLQDGLLEGLGGEAAELEATGDRVAECGDAAFSLKCLPEARLRIVVDDVAEVGVAAGFGIEPAAGDGEVGRGQADPRVDRARRHEAGQETGDHETAEQGSEAGYWHGTTGRDGPGDDVSEEVVTIGRLPDDGGLTPVGARPCPGGPSGSRTVRDRGMLPTEPGRE